MIEVAIIGAGPAGLAAAVYLKRKQVDLRLFGKELGGYVMETSTIENYLGFPTVTGFDLTQSYKKHLESLQIATEEQTVTTLTKSAEGFDLTLESGEKVSAKAVILAQGARHKTLGVPGEKEFTHRGVTYCSTCDAPLFKDKEMVVVGSGNSGLEAVLEYALYASKIHLVEFMDHLMGDEVLQKQVLALPKVHVMTSHKVLEIVGEKLVKAVKLQDMATGQTVELAVQGVSVHVGLAANSELEQLTAKNERQEIQVDAKCATSVTGIFAAGDVTDVPYKQIQVAAGEGVKAALSVYDFLKRK